MCSMCCCAEAALRLRAGLAVEDRMSAVVEVANPFGEIDISGSEFDQEALAALAPLAAVGVGLALRSVGDR